MKTAMTVLAIAALYICAWAADNTVVGARPTASRQAPTANLQSPDAIIIPKLLSYQGKMTDTFGLPVADTTYSVAFRLYTAPSGGSSFWNETQTVRTRSGLFSTLLGSVAQIESVPSAGNLYLGMAVAGGAELSPRLRIVGSAYSYLAGKSANSDLLQGKDTTALDARYINEAQANSVSSAMITNGTIAAVDLNQMGAGTGQVMKWTGSAWAPRNDSVGGGGGGGTVTSVSQTTGVVCTPNPITTTGTVGFDQTYGDGRYVNEAQANSVTGAMITDGQVTSADIRDTTVNTAELKNAAVTAPKLNQMGATTNQVLKWTGSAWAPANDSAGAGDNAWVRSGSDSVLYTIRYLGVARGGSNNKLWGTAAYSHVNLGVTCTTGTSGQNFGYATVGGGQENAAAGILTTVGGGGVNRASGTGATVAGGGRMNVASGDYASVGGGEADTAKAVHGGVLSGYSNLAGDAAADTGACVVGGRDNSATGKYASVGGGRTNSASNSYAIVGGGFGNAAGGEDATIGGGYYNSASGYAATVSGGDRNTASADDAVVGGGLQNTASALYAAVGGGRANVAAGRFSTVGGGYADTVKALYGGVLSGYSNLAGDAETDTGATVCGGYGNFAAEYFSAVGGGKNNYAGLVSVVAGGRDNAAYGASAVGGGVGNSSAGSYAAIAGGSNNDIDNGYGSFIGAGTGNSVPEAGHVVIGGGENNEASGGHAVLGGGENNDVSGKYAVLVGGENNDVSGNHAALVGGNYNMASGDLSMVLGGAYNAARANYTLAAGRYARANHYGGFVWSDQSASASESLYTTGTNQFRVRARGGTWFYSNAAKSTGAYLAPGSNSWESACDSMTKEDFRPVDRKALLDKVAALRVRDYKMKDQHDGTRHIGPVAQDFYSAFGVGGTETGINLADADGVALAAIQALYDQNQALSKRVAELEARLVGQQ